MKTKFILFATIFGLGLSATSCSDLLEVESDRQIEKPALDQKTDSIFYTLGILRGVQQAADMYVLTNELRGDLVSPTKDASKALRELYNFSATTTNKYDSAYVYYNVINNCNYYIAHRDTSLRTGSRQVAMQEFVQAKSIRAWAYMQLAKTYGRVPFFTHPLENISQVEAVSDYRTLPEICEVLAADLEPHKGMGVPNYGNIDAGARPSGGNKTVPSAKMMFPVDLVLGDLYLEAGQYEKAAQAYFTYVNANPSFISETTASPGRYYDRYMDVFPRNIMTFSANDWGSAAFDGDNPKDVITMIPMATSKLRGLTTELPELFGLDVYSTDAVFSQNRTVQLEASPVYTALSASVPYYYATFDQNRQLQYTALPVGDMRIYGQNMSYYLNNKRESYVRKYSRANINVYRGSVVLLRMAEAMNRMGYPDAAFAMLKDGICEALVLDTLYIRDTTRTMLSTVLPFLSEANFSKYPINYGIHSHGAGYTAGMRQNLYTYEGEVMRKVNEIRRMKGQPEATELPSLEEQINAMEDLLCDELALETAYEGLRFGDLCRLARHKNADPLWGDNYGSQWLAQKLAFKNPVVDLTNPDNWYLPLMKSKK